MYDYGDWERSASYRREQLLKEAKQELLLRQCGNGDARRSAWLPNSAIGVLGAATIAGMLFSL